ncbi:MAG: SPFH domain-containing protein [Pseudomonadota bacterium]
MTERMNAIAAAIREGFGGLGNALRALGRRALDSRGAIVGATVVAVVGWGLWKHPPMQAVERGELGVRSNRLTGTVAQFRDGGVLVLPGVHEMRVYPLRDQVYRPLQVARATGEAPLQSLEGLSIGVDLAVRYALDPARIASLSGALPEDLNGQVVEPAVQGVIYKVFTRYTVREIFSTKRAEIQQQVESELRGKLAADGIVLRSVLMGKVDLPADYRHGMDKLLAEELETERMRYTIELKNKQVVQTALEAEAEKVRREKSAEAAAREQVIAARAQEEAMKHVLPFKQKQIEQRQLEAEADKLSRIRTAEGQAQARRIEAAGEADSRQKLADAEAYRLDRLGKVNSEQMAREGALITQHPLLIQKTLADKLSDKVQVIIAPPPGDGGFIGAGLIGGAKAQTTAHAGQVTRSAQ